MQIFPREHTRSSSRPIHVRVLALAAMVALAGLLVAGCGSSKSKSTSTATVAAKPALTKAEFVAQANAICREGNKQNATAQKTLAKAIGNKQPTAVEVKGFANAYFIPNIQSQIDRIKALAAPAGEQATVTHVLDIAQTDLNAVKSDPVSLLTHNPFVHFARIAHAYGLRSCASKA